jgi:hypothetical protein
LPAKRRSGNEGRDATFASGTSEDSS